MSSDYLEQTARKPRKKLLSSTPKSYYERIVNEPKTVNLVNELNDKPIINNGCYLYAQQFFFHDTPEFDIINKLTTIKETRNRELIIATDHGQIGILERHDSEAKWSAIYRCYFVEEDSSSDRLYAQHKKLLIDLCIDDGNNLFVLTKLNSSEFFLEKYDFNETFREILLTNIINLNQSLGLNFENLSFELVRICYDKSSKLLVLIDEKNSKLIWYNPMTLSAKKSLSSNESLEMPNSILFVENIGCYISSKKGIIIRNKEKEAVLHQVPLKSYPLDLCYSNEDEKIYFIDKFNLYRARVNDLQTNLLRYRNVLSTNESILNKTGFTRVLCVKDWLYLMIKEENSIISIKKSELI